MLSTFLMAASLLAAPPTPAPRQLENLGRGVVAVDRGDGSVLVSWRLLGNDPEDAAFDVYRTTGGGQALRLNSTPLTGGTNFVDREVAVDKPQAYSVRLLSGGETAEGRAHRLIPGQPCLALPLQTPEGYAPNDATAGDLDGDGEYEIVLHQAGRGRDNSQAGFTDPPILEAYRLDGAMLWRISLGFNIREGAHYTQFLVYDLDGDGRSEVACKTADGSVDGQGHTIGDAAADHRDPQGRVLKGPEYLTVFDGRTGATLATEPYVPPRGDVSAWGDDSGNRADRYLACVAYLDGQRPSLVMCRGYYTRTVLAAWNYRDGKLSQLWTFDSDSGRAADAAYRGQGNHNLAVADVDGDGRDEIVYGACAIDDDGRGLYTTGLGHGDAMHLSDLDPSRPGLEVWGIHERPSHPHGANLRDAATGQVLWSLPLADPGRGLAMDIDPRHPGCECWASNSAGLFNCRGERIASAAPRSCNMGIWWDGDLLREILDGSGGGRGAADRGGAFIDKWEFLENRSIRLLSGGDHDCVTINGSKANPCLCADLFGDWREEVVWRTRDGRELRIFTTPFPTDHRLVCLMHDPVYRLAVAWQNVAYNQPAHPGYFLGDGMAMPPRPAIHTRPRR